MKSLWKCLIRSALTVSLSAGSVAMVSAQESGQAGIVRISKPRTSSIASNQVMPVNALMSSNECVPPAPVSGGSPAAGAPMASSQPPMMSSGSMGMGPMGMGSCDDGSCQNGAGYSRRDWRTVDWQSSNAWGAGLHARTQAYSMGLMHGGGSMYYHDPTGHAMLDYFKCKFGYFIPSGGAGHGIPWVGKYARVYPVNPAYSDPRDGQTWAAQGYGIPLAVPLAPVVGHTYDYGWGVPSSRLTPVSNPAY